MKGLKYHEAPKEKFDRIMIPLVQVNKAKLAEKIKNKPIKGKDWTALRSAGAPDDPPIRRGKQRPKFETLPCTKLDRRLEAHLLDSQLLADQV